VLASYPHVCRKSIGQRYHDQGNAISKQKLCFQTRFPFQRYRHLIPFGQTNLVSLLSLLMSEEGYSLLLSWFSHDDACLYWGLVWIRGGAWRDSFNRSGISRGVSAKSVFRIGSQYNYVIKAVVMYSRSGLRSTDSNRLDKMKRSNKRMVKEGYDMAH
jgi:hypothetical protein